MKTKTWVIGGFSFGWVLAMMMFSSTVTTVMAEHKKGAEYQMQKIETQADAEALRPGDEIAMACAKCKSVATTHVTTEKGHIKLMTPGEKHLCPGCKSTISVVGAGKGAKDEVKHVCEKCGEDSVYCCATKPGSGATKGMEKKE